MLQLRNFARIAVLNMETMEHQTPEQRESLWRRKLSAAERAGLRGQPELELEARLTEALTQLPELARALQFHRPRAGGH